MAMPRPSLEFDFSRMDGALDPRITFTRPSIGSYYDRSQVLRYRPANAPRFTYGGGGVSNGLIQEQNAINRLLWSEAFDNAAWGKTNTTVTANTTIAPDGNLTADTLTATGSGGGAWQTCPITVGNTVVLQAYVMAGASNFARLLIYDGTSGSAINIWFDLVNNVVGTHQPGTSSNLLYLSSSMEVLPGGWRRVRVSATTSVIGTVNCYVGPAPADNILQVAGNSIIAWGAQLSDFSPGQGYASSYMPTTSATATRLGETAVINTLDPSWWNPLAGTIVGTAVNMMSAACYLFGIGNTTADYMQLLSGPNSGANLVVGQVISAGVSQFNFGVAGSRPYDETDVPLHFAMAWQANDTAVAANGGVFSRAGAALPTSMVRIKIGGPGWAATTSNLEGQIRRLAYYPQRLTNAQLQQLTAG